MTVGAGFVGQSGASKILTNVRKFEMLGNNLYVVFLPWWLLCTHSILVTILL